MFVRIGAVHRIAEKGERSACFNGRLQNQTNHIFELYLGLGNAGIVHAVVITSLPLFTVIIFKLIAFDAFNLMRTHQIPRLIHIFTHHFPEKIGVANGRKDIVRFHAVVTIIRAKLQKIKNILMPYIEIAGYGSGAHAKLIDGHSRVVRQFDPSHNAACRAFIAANVAAIGAYFSEIESHAASEFGDIGKIGDAPINSVERIGDSIDKAARHLVMRFAGIGHRGCSHRHLQFTEDIVDIAYNP